MTKDILSLTLPALEEVLTQMGQPAWRARQVFQWLHIHRVTNFEAMSNLSKVLREQLAQQYEVGYLPAVRRLSSRLDATEKFLLELSDQNRVEAVWMEYKHGNTVCISTQVGCRMGCRFCASTLGGLVRSLTAGEMIEEVYALERETGKKVGGVVLMGIGEPLDNFENVVDFLNILSDSQGMGLSLRHVSLSTCGLVPQIDRLAQLKLPLTLSVSLHAPDDDTRNAIMPINQKYSVDELMAACCRYFASTGRRISFEYALISGQNDTPRHAKRLARRLDCSMPCHVNLIPVNEVKERGCRRGDRASIERFRAMLEAEGINATIRRELGSDIQAACGQLRREDGALQDRRGHEEC